MHRACLLYTSVKAELGNLDAPKEAEVTAELNKENEDVEVAATSKEDIETKCSEPAETPIAVSYTHLDVYKRQRIHSPS